MISVVFSSIDKFFTDTYTLKETIKLILKDINEHCNSNINIKIQATDLGTQIEIKIIHLNSSSPKTAKVLEKTIEDNGGNFKTIYNNLKSLCDWSINTICNDSKGYHIDFLYPEIDNEKPHSRPIDDKIEGFTHILRFYK